jgi:amidase
VRSATPQPSARAWLSRLESRELSARELAEQYLSRIDAVNGRLNAVVALDRERVLRDADGADRLRAAGESGALLGLPVTIKDSIGVLGFPCTSGSLARSAHMPHRDATVVARLRAAGAIVVAKTNVPEYTWSYETENVLYGRTVHPRDPDRTPGGSSGGEAALLAVDASPVGIGTDGLGSIRVPCHYCGVVGLRPTSRLVPETGCWPTTRDTGMMDMNSVGPMGRVVDDLALLLPIIAGADGEDPYAGGPAVRDYRSVDAGRLRVGVYVDDGVSPVSPETERAVRRAAHVLEAAGATVEDATPPPLEGVTDLAFGMMAADGGAKARADLAAAGDHVEQMAWLLDDLRRYALTADGFFALLRRWIDVRARLRMFLRGYDVVLCPVLPGPAPLHGCRPGDDAPLEDYLAFSYVQAYSIAALPVAVVPVGAERGLPIGVQVVAAPFEDHVALAAAATLEEALGAAQAEHEDVVSPSWTP